MKSKIVIILSSMILLAMLLGCAAPPSDGNQGIMTNDIPYVVIDEAELDSDILDMIEEIKKEKGYAVIKEEEGFYYVFIGSGEKPTGGYGISIKSAEDIEGRTVIIIEETSPGKDEMVTEALTYPYVVIKINKDLFINVTIESNSKEEMKEITSKEDKRLRSYSIIGNITEITFNEDGAVILVEGEKTSRTEYDKAYIKIDSKTRITIKDADATADMLAKGMRVAAVFEGPVAESYPVQAYASEIIEGVYEGEIDVPSEIGFEVSDEEEDSIGNIKEIRGFSIIREANGFYYVFIGSGERPTGGYYIKTQSVRAEGGSLVITVKEYAPGKDDMVAQVITYPYQIIKISNTYGRDITVITEDGEMLRDINEKIQDGR